MDPTTPRMAWVGGGVTIWRRGGGEAWGGTYWLGSVVGCVLKVKWLAVGPSGLQKINFGPLFESLQNSASNDIGPRIFDRRRGCRSDSDRGPMSFTGVVLKTSKRGADVQDPEDLTAQR